MSGLALAGRYAKALFELAEKNKSSAQIEGDLQQLLRVVNEVPELHAAINNPAISKTVIDGVMSQILNKSGANKLTVSFISVLVQNNRIKYLASVVASYVNIMMQNRSEENAFITTSTPLNQKQITEIEQSLSKALGHKIKPVTAVNADLLGGIVVRIGSKMLDASISGQLNRMEVLNKKAIANLH